MIRRLLAAAALTVVLAIPITGLSDAALAHHPIPVGQAVCVDGAPKVVWTVRADAVRGYAWSVNGAAAQPDSQPFTFTTGTTAFQATATWWNSSGQHVAGPETRTGGPVALRADCVPPTTSTTSSTSTTSVASTSTLSTVLAPTTSSSPIATAPATTSGPSSTVACAEGETRAEDGTCVPPGYYPTTTVVDIGVPPEVPTVPPPATPDTLPATGGTSTLAVAAGLVLAVGVVLVAVRKMARR